MAGRQQHVVGCDEEMLDLLLCLISVEDPGLAAGEPVDIDDAQIDLADDDGRDHQGRKQENGPEEGTQDVLGILHGRAIGGPGMAEIRGSFHGRRCLELHVLAVASCLRGAVCGNIARRFPLSRP